MKALKFPAKTLNRRTIKYIAAIAMVLDHIAAIFIPVSHYAALYALMRIIGRLTAPIMCFFLAEGYAHTRDRRRYALRLLIFGLISQAPYVLAHYCYLWVADFNVILCLFLCFMMLVAYDEIKTLWVKWVVVLGLILLSMYCDWGMFAPFFVLIFYVNRDDRTQQVNWYCAGSLLMILSSIFYNLRAGFQWYGELWQLGLFLFIPVMYMYNGKAGKKSAFNKWFFYVLYPVHLMIFYLMQLVI